jgi:hypothetical protein
VVPVVEEAAYVIFVKDSKIAVLSNNFFINKTLSKSHISSVKRLLQIATASIHKP